MTEFMTYVMEGGVMGYPEFELNTDAVIAAAELAFWGSIMNYGSYNLFPEIIPQPVEHVGYPNITVVLERGSVEINTYVSNYKRSQGDQVFYEFHIPYDDLFELFEENTYIPDLPVFNNPGFSYGDFSSELLNIPDFTHRGSFIIIWDREEVRNYLNSGGIINNIGINEYSSYDRIGETPYESNDEEIDPDEIILESNPITLPYKNVFRNSHFDNVRTSKTNCVIEIFIKNKFGDLPSLLGYFGKIEHPANKKIVSNTSLRNIKQYCRDRKYNIVMYNINGDEFSRVTSKSSKKMLHVIIYNKHMYQCDFTKKIRKLEYIGPKYDERHEHPGCPVFKIDIPEVSANKKRFAALDSGNFSYACETGLRSLALSYNDRTGDKSSWSKIDMNSCYYESFTRNVGLCDIPVFSVQDIFMKYDDSEIDDEYIYLFKITDKIRKIGLNSNHVHGFLMKLIKTVVIVEITHYRIPSSSMSASTVLDLYRETDDAGRPGKFDDWRECMGITGKSHSDEKRYSAALTNDQDIKLTRHRDRDLRKDGCGGLYSVTKKLEYRMLNNRNIYNWQIDIANYEILKMIIAMKRRGYSTGSINTDSIEYYKFGHYDPIIADGWKREDIVERSVSTDTGDSMKSKSYDGDWYIEKMNKELMKYSENIKSFQGPPGSGKSYLAKKEEYDFSTTLSNCLARENDNGETKCMTLYKFFGESSLSSFHQKRDIMRRYKNKRIWCDEISMLGVKYWNCIVNSIYSVNTEWILTGDYNQLPPVGCTELSIMDVRNALLKNTTFLTVDHRNSECLVKFRDDVLNSTEKYQILKVCWSGNNHITHTNNYRKFINGRLMQMRRMVFTEDHITRGMVLSCHSNNKKLDVCKGVVYIVNEEYYDTQSHISLRYNRGGVEYTKLFDKKVIYHLKPGYCRTVHSTQGLTIVGDVVIHDPCSMDKQLLYTAITRVRSLENIYFVRKSVDYNKNLIYSDMVIKPYDSGEFFEQIVNYIRDRNILGVSDLGEDKRRELMEEILQSGKFTTYMREVVDKKISVHREILCQRGEYTEYDYIFEGAADNYLFKRSSENPVYLERMRDFSVGGFTEYVRSVNRVNIVFKPAGVKLGDKYRHPSNDELNNLLDMECMENDTYAIYNLLLVCLMDDMDGIEDLDRLIDYDEKLYADYDSNHKFFMETLHTFILLSGPERAIRSICEFNRDAFEKYLIDILHHHKDPVRHIRNNFFTIALDAFIRLCVPGGILITSELDLDKFDIDEFEEHLLDPARRYKKVVIVDGVVIDDEYDNIDEFEKYMIDLLHHRGAPVCRYKKVVIDDEVVTDDECGDSDFEYNGVFSDDEVVIDDEDDEYDDIDPDEIII